MCCGLCSVLSACGHKSEDMPHAANSTALENGSFLFRCKALCGLDLQTHNPKRQTINTFGIICRIIAWNMHLFQSVFYSSLLAKDEMLHSHIYVKQVCFCFCALLFHVSIHFC